MRHLVTFDKYREENRISKRARLQENISYVTHRAELKGPWPESQGDRPAAQDIFCGLSAGGCALRASPCCPGLPGPPGL